MLEEIAARTEPLSLEELDKFSTDYDADLDEEVGETPVEYTCEDEGIPIYMAEKTNPQTEDQASW